MQVENSTALKHFRQALGLLFKPNIRDVNEAIVVLTNSSKWESFGKVFVLLLSRREIGFDHYFTFTDFSSSFLQEKTLRTLSLWV